MELVFYKSKEHKNYYFIYKGRNGVDPNTMLEKITHTGEHKESGFVHAEIELGFVIKAGTAESFLDYLIENVATNHIGNPEYDNSTFRSWYEFKEVNQTDKWLNDFAFYQRQKLLESKIAEGKIQTTLF